MPAPEVDFGSMTNLEVRELVGEAFAELSGDDIAQVIIDYVPDDAIDAINVKLDEYLTGLADESDSTDEAE